MFLMEVKESQPDKIMEYFKKMSPIYKRLLYEKSFNQEVILVPPLYREQ